jgi:four helix bundle protein
MTTRHGFAHHKLDAYHRSAELLGRVHTAQKRIPRGYRSLADQLLRAATSVVLNLGEGANRYGVGEKRAAFSRARGECGEVAVAIEVATALGFIASADAEEMLELAGRVAAMLTRLIQRQR